jgi:hypothetical protein
VTHGWSFLAVDFEARFGEHFAGFDEYRKEIAQNYGETSK